MLFGVQGTTRPTRAGVLQEVPGSVHEALAKRARVCEEERGNKLITRTPENTRRCGNLKWPNRTLCKSCWLMLPQDEKDTVAKERDVQLDTDPHPAAQVLHQVALSEAQMDRIYMSAPFEQKRAAIHGLLKWDRENRL